MPERVLVAEPLLAGPDVLPRPSLFDLAPELRRDRVALVSAVADRSALVVRNEVRVDRELLDAAPRLRVIGRLGAGLDNLAIDEMRERGITIVHGGGLNARAVAEYVIAAALHLARGLGRADRSVRLGLWQRDPGFELRGQRIGVVGLGRTGAGTARLARAVGMRVRGYDPYAPTPPAGVLAVPLAELLRTSKVVTVHVPYTEATRRLIDATALASMPPGALLINAARGGVVDEDALYAALASGRIGGAALDVRCSEPPGAGDRFAALENVLLTPHLAGLTAESQSAIARSVLADVLRVLGGHAPRGPAILPSSGSASPGRAAAPPMPISRDRLSVRDGYA